MNTVQEVEKYAADHGIILSPSDRAKIGLVQQEEMKRLQALTPQQESTWVDWWNRFYPRLLETIVSVGNTVLTFSQTVLTALGVPLVLVLLLVVEHHRVVEGIRLFDENPTFAGFAAAALVLLNLVLEFQVHYIEHQAGYSESRAARWSFRIFAMNMKYRIGYANDWTEQQLSPAARYKSLLRLVTFTILGLALAGSMRAVISQTTGAWYQAIMSIITESSLLLMLTWLGGLLFAAAAVLSAQGLSRYVAIRCVEIIRTMNKQQETTTNPHHAEIDRAGAMVALALVNDKLAKRDKKGGDSVSTVPLFPAPVIVEHQPEYISSNGNGKH